MLKFPKYHLLIISHYYCIMSTVFHIVDVLLEDFFLTPSYLPIMGNYGPRLSSDKSSINNEILDYIFKKLLFYIAGKKANRYGR